jgi:phage tail-like protein
VTATTQVTGFTATRRRKLIETTQADSRIPRVASQRSYLRGGLPPVYQEGDFGLRFVAALEEGLDPIVALLDGLAAHFSAEMAPLDILELLGAWVGEMPEEAWPEPVQRAWVRSSAELARRRGTRRGLELALSIAFPDLPLRVEDGGRVAWAAASDKLPPAGTATLVVYCDTPIPEARQASIARLIEQVKPVHVGHRLRVKVPRPPKAAGS